MNGVNCSRIFRVALINYLHVNEGNKLVQKIKAAPADSRDGFQNASQKLLIVSSFISAGFFFNNFSYRICFSSSWSTGENNLFVFHGFFYLFGKVHIVVFLFVFLNLQIILFVAFLTLFVTF